MKPSLCLSLALATLATSAFAENHHAHWSYSGNESPEHWGDLNSDYVTCKIGKSQSPVDLVDSQAHKMHIASGYFATETNYQLENNGHTLQAAVMENAPRITIAGKRYSLKQFHFHTPSEHTFKGQHYPIEIHFVHQAEDNALAVLAVMVNKGEANKTLAALFQTSLKQGEKITLDKPLGIRTLFPQKKIHYRLMGSLTTPPCSENVTWEVFKNPISASQAQIKKLENVIGHNNRPVQPMNHRNLVEEE